jgi:aldehyde:ferredoxin oxidoreductase
MLLPFDTREPIQQLHEAGLVLSQWSSWAKGVEEAHISSDVLRGIAERFWGSKQAGDMTTLAGKAEAASRIQNRQFAKESAEICDCMFPIIDNPSRDDKKARIGDPSVEARLLSAALGREITEEEYYRIGERVFSLQRAVLLREGHSSPDDDVLPREYHEDPLKYYVADPGAY